MSPTYKLTQIRKREIIDAARKIIANKGMKELTVREVARGVGISEGNIYRHFQSKKDILFLLMDDVELTLSNAIRESVSPEKSTLENLEGILKAHISESEQMRGLSFIIIAETMRLGDEDLRQRMFQVVTKYLNNISNMLDEGVKKGTIRNDIDPDAAALMFFALVQSVVTLWSLSSYSLDLFHRIMPLWKEYRAGIICAANERPPIDPSGVLCQ
jgi:AcrR family transcriptional regulator